MPSHSLRCQYRSANAVPKGKFGTNSRDGREIPEESHEFLCQRTATQGVIPSCMGRSFGEALASDEADFEFIRNERTTKCQLTISVASRSHPAISRSSACWFRVA